MNLGTTRLRGRPRSRWQDEVREDGRIVGGEGWQEKVHNREEWKKLLRTARDRRILHMANGMNEWNDSYEVNFWETGSRSRRGSCHKSNILLSVVLPVLHALLWSLQSLYHSFHTLNSQKISSELKVRQKYASLLK